jgi:NAD(P)-dependent dehydrogenase (short-subunit alcohol dehydrogenase family)
MIVPIILSTSSQLKVSGSNDATQMTTPGTASSIPDQSGRTAVVTGANSGVGFETAKALAERGAAVVLACRDVEKASDAASRIRAGVKDATLSILRLDLASLSSVRHAAADLRSRVGEVDLVINNAGVMRTPPAQTADGFELQFATNHLGHFAFTGLILDRLLPTPGSRVVTVTSPAHRQAQETDFEDLRSPRLHSPARAYARSKLANLLFTYELQRRLAAAGRETVALAAHPGGSRTQLNRHLAAPFRGPSWGLARPITQPAATGALSILRAATDPDARAGDYWAPHGRMEFKGHPMRRESNELSHDRDLQAHLWSLSEQLTGITFPLSSDRQPAGGR